MRLILVVFLAFLVTVCNESVQAQESGSNENQKKEEKVPETGQIQGAVKDALGKPLAGVALRLQSADGQVVSQTQTDNDGLFTFTAVAPGTYAVVGEKDKFQSATAIVTLAEGSIEKTTLTLKTNQALEMAVITERLNRVRNGLSPEAGSSVYRFDQKDITNLPQGVQTPMNQVLLQTPGVAQDSYGQVHVRGEHANIQYRLNGILLPEGITGFGQVLDARFVDRLNFLTGALPAQYGYRTAGVVDIHTKEGAFVNGGRVDLYGGSYKHIEPSVEFGGSKGAFNYYVSASYLQNDFGVESPTPDPHPIHDHTQQGKAFGYFSYLLNPTLRLSLVLGDAEARFEIPNNPGQPPQFNLPPVCTVPSPCTVNSAGLDENQRESNRYGVLALQGTAGSKFDYQMAFFSRYSEVLFEPDHNGDLVFNGVAARVERSSFSNGLQGDGSYRLNESHTVRAGFFISGERAISDNTSTVFSTLGGCDPTTGACPTDTIVDDNGKTAWLYGLYLQDEWRPTDKLTVNYGVRGDAVSAYVNANQVSPRIGAVYQATSRTILHAAYARYFTPPPTELVAPTDLAKFDNTTNAPPCAFTGPPCQDSNVLPERSHYFDAGVTHQLTPSLSLGLDGYYKIVHDLLDEGQFGQALVFTPFNYKDGKIYGVELTGGFKKDNFSSYLNLAYSKAMGRDIVSSQFNIDPDELAYIANHYVHLDHDQAITSSAGASYLWAGTNFTADALYGSGLRKGFANTEKLRDNFQVNLGLSHGVVVPRIGRLEGRFVVLNLFDRTNELRDGTGIGVGAPQFATRRAFYGGVNLAF